MIDPNLENHQIQHTQLPPNYATLHMQQNAAAIHGQNNGFPNPIHTPSNAAAPIQRTLPARDVKDSSLDDAYVQFIMYCNPSIPLDMDSAELRKGFRNPPKSDGKSFSPFRLYELISKLEGGDIKTWNQLVIDLGVDLPDATKNQSTQKVQQYAVRLKVNPFNFCLPLSRAFAHSRIILLIFQMVAMAQSLPCRFFLLLSK